MNHRLSESIIAEFDGAQLGDKRRDARLVQIAQALAARPDASFPKVFEDDAALEAFYRFVRNPKVTFEKTIAPHIDSSWRRVEEHDSVLVIHDTSALSFGDARGGRREGLGRINQADQGMMMHASLAVSDPMRREPLGVLAVKTWTRSDTSRRAVRRSGERKKANAMAFEQARWNEHINAVEKRARRRAVIHLLDSEGDDYAILANLKANDARFVVRGYVDRRLNNDGAKLWEHLASAQAQCCYTVEVSKRGRPIGGSNAERRGRNVARDRRDARVEACATRVTLKRPGNLKHKDATLEVSVVHVREINPPDGEEPVDWVLYTDASIDCATHMLDVIAMYRTRWLIEEFFKALKTGCAYEERQLDSVTTLTNALALLLPVAWGILRVRSLSQTHPEAPAETVLTPSQLAVLRIRRPKMLPDKPTVADALLAIAAMGGHIKNNGPPGWQTLLAATSTSSSSMSSPLNSDTQDVINDQPRGGRVLLGADVVSFVLILFDTVFADTGVGVC